MDDQREAYLGGIESFCTAGDEAVQIVSAYKGSP